jgi:hypothetical protein
MAEQPRPWAERTLEVPPQDPWADPPTPAFPPAAPGGHAPPGVPRSPYTRGVAHVTPRTREFTAEHEPTGTGWPGAAAPEDHRPSGARRGQWRRGGEWSSAAALFAFVCWGVSAIANGRSLVTPAITFALILLVAAGLFALSRLVGHVVLERQLRRPRRTARGSHVLTAAFLVGVGVTYLRQTEWVMTAYHWVAHMIH